MKNWCPKTVRPLPRSFVRVFATPGAKHREDALATLCAGVLAGIIVLIVARDYPLVGHDFGYYIPRLLDTDLHIRVTGLAVQWYTPTFGGGLPAFPNPQHLQHSLLQALTYFVNPWMAIITTLFVVSVVGFVAMYRFLRRRLNLDALPSMLGAAFFVGNGFFLEHMIVGHVGFMLFPLAAILLAALVDARRTAAKNACIVAIAVAAMVYQASVYLIVLVGLTLALTVPMLYLLDVRIAWRRLFVIGAGGAALMLAMTAAKLYAGFALMRQFPREISDAHDAGVLQGLLGIAAQLAGVMTIVPALVAAGIDVSRVRDVLSGLVGSEPRIGLWELDTGLSPVLIVTLAVTVALSLTRAAKEGLPGLTRAQLTALVVVVAITWIAVEAALASGFAYPYLKSLPVVRSLHVNPRITAVFILPLSIAGAIALHRWSLATRQRAPLAAALALSILSPLVFWLLPAAMHQRLFDVTLSVGDAARIRAGDRFTVDRIADVPDAVALSIGASSLRPYEPMFGYNLDDFAAEVHPGSVRGYGGDGYFNMTNPASLVFPELNGVHRFERIPTEDAARLEAFVHRLQPDWRVPPILHVLNWVAVVSVTVAIAALGILR